MPDPKSLRIGDLVRFTDLPEEWARPGFLVPGSSRAFMNKMLKRSWPSRVYKVDEQGHAWIRARFCERGRFHYHDWMIVESSGWRLVRRRMAEKQ
jgi:hypothetical protein